ncbi:hypothetical protein SD71_05275 [Cohnella kolymensis]|uniref:Uncharacterized protein n=1 Tax=Cohnella kolymensis TaxID=1590652 RepID=A0ABR5A8U0_9BACL|nr:hypothetical protein [Cohnella kolymensis]KIL36822.1 hypothetical protein SD71_05275 [Cohnella kolymensis]
MKQLLVFVLFAAMFCWLMFSPIYKHVLVIRQALLQQETDYLLEIGASGKYGYIDGAMVAESRNRLGQYGFNAASLNYEIATTTGAEGDNAQAPVTRGVGIRLSITYPYENLLNIDRLIGIQPPSANARISGRGMKMSEYVP